MNITTWTKTMFVVIATSQISEKKTKLFWIDEKSLQLFTIWKGALDFLLLYFEYHPYSTNSIDI